MSRRMNERNRDSGNQSWRMTMGECKTSILN